MPASFNTPLAWTNQRLTLYHGTLLRHVPAIRKGIVPSRGSLGTDFGQGFYKTTVLDQAKSWAWLLEQKAALRGTPSPGAVMVFEADRDALARLDTLVFVRGERLAYDFWSFVFHCRKSLPGHGRIGTGQWYDVVYGPVAAFWAQKSAMADSDQISFHTAAVATVLSYKTTLKLR